MSEVDSWGRPPPDPLPKVDRRAARSPSERLAWIVLRGLVFIPGAMLGFVLAFGYAYTGQLVVSAVQLLVVPASIVCWIQASAGKAGDRWTVGYLTFWVLNVVALLIGHRIL